MAGQVTTHYSAPEIEAAGMLRHLLILRRTTLGAVSQVSEFHGLFPGTRRIERFAEAGQQRVDAGEVRAAVRNLRTNPELRDGERVQEANELSSRKSSARHVR